MWLSVSLLFMWLRGSMLENLTLFLLMTFILWIELLSVLLSYYSSVRDCWNETLFILRLPNWFSMSSSVPMLNCLSRKFSSGRLICYAFGVEVDGSWSSWLDFCGKVIVSSVFYSSSSDLSSILLKIHGNFLDSTLPTGVMILSLV